MERYGTVAMNHIQLSAYARSGKGASSRSTHVERNNQVFTDLARSSSVIEAGKNSPLAGAGLALGSRASVLGNVNDAPAIVSAQKLVRRCDRRRFRLDQ